MGRALVDEGVTLGYSPRTVNRVLPADLASVGEARSLVRQVLGGWRADAIVDDVVLVASELVSNALRYGLNLPGPAGLEGADPGGPGVWVSLARTTTHVICTVSDPSRQPPVRRVSDPMTGCGQGLALVESLSACWGWSALDTRPDGAGQPGPVGGKSVWAIFTLQPATSTWAAGAA